MTKVKIKLSEFFRYHPRERDGLLSILALGLLLWLFPYFLPRGEDVTSSSAPIFIDEIRKASASSEQTTTDQTAEVKTLVKDHDMEESGDIKADSIKIHDQLPDSFDPNHLSDSLILLLPINPTARKAWINYRAKGGVFRQPGDLRKLYGMRSHDYEKLKGRIKLQKKIQPAIDINSANAKEWESLHGIGPYYASKIITFRKSLGGFTHIEQVAQTYALPDSVFNTIKPFLFLKEVHKRIPVNSASRDDLASHPYISWKEAEWIVNYRQQHGPFSQISDLKKIHTLSNQFLEKAGNYLSFDLPEEF